MAARLNLKIEQGATFDKTVTWKTGDPAAAVDLTGCTARAQFRSDIDSSEVLLDLTTGNNRLVLGGSDGTIQFLIDADDTADITWDDAVYDLEIIFGDGTVRRLLAGTVSVSKEVTR